MLRTARRVADHSFDLPPLPSRVISLDGQLVDTSAVCWRFRSSSDGGKLILIPWDRLDEPATLRERARHLAKLFLADKVSRKKARTIENDFRMFRRFQDWQEPFVNPTLANHALALLARLFRYGSITYHGAFVNVAGSRVQPLAADPVVWRALQRRGKRRIR